MLLLEICHENKERPDIGRQCQRLLQDIAAWTVSEQLVSQLLPEATPAQQRQTRSQLNREEIRTAMLVLSHDALLNGLEVRENFSIRRLARVLDGPRCESMQRSLRNWMLPLLHEVGWIEGIRESNGESVTAHAISVTPKGLSAVANYIARLS